MSDWVVFRDGITWLRRSAIESLDLRQTERVHWTLTLRMRSGVEHSLSGRPDVLQALVTECVKSVPEGEIPTVPIDSETLAKFIRDNAGVSPP